MRNFYRRQELRVGPQSRRSPLRDRRLWSTVPTGRRDSGHDPGKKHHRHGWPKKLWPRPKLGLSATLWTTALAADVAYVALLRQVAGQPLPAEFNIKFIEKGENVDALIVLPDFVPHNAELSVEELEAVAARSKAIGRTRDPLAPPHRTPDGRDQERRRADRSR